MIGTHGGATTLLSVDLFTGRFTERIRTIELTGLGKVGSDANVATRRDRGMWSGTVLTVDDWLEERDQAICVVFTDRNGRVDHFFTLDGALPGPAKTSFDGSHVVVNRSDQAEGASAISLFTRNGDFVESFAQPNELDSAGAYAFLPDGRLVYSMEDDVLLPPSQSTGVIITDPYDTTPQRRILLPAFYQNGRITTIESSPDGSRLLINVKPAVGPTRPIIVELETLMVTQLIDREDGGLVDAKSVAWGAGGEWVYVVMSTSDLLSESALVGSAVEFIGSADALFAYRSDLTRQPVPLEPDDLSDSVRVIPTDNPREPGGQVGGGQYDGKLIWIP